MEAISQLFNVFGVDVVFVDGDLLAREDYGQVLCHQLGVFLRVKRGDFTGVENVIHIFEETLMHDLRVIQDEGSGSASSACCQHFLFQCFTEITRLEVLAQLHLEALVLKDRCCKLRQALLATA